MRPRGIGPPLRGEELGAEHLGLPLCCLEESRRVGADAADGGIVAKQHRRDLPGASDQSPLAAGGVSR